MKKITLGLLVVLTVMAFVVGCSNFGATGNPTDLTGVWTGSTTSFGAPTSLVGTAEGTWYLVDVTLPTPPTVYTDEAGVTWTNYGGTPADTRTITETTTVEIAADTSWVKTYTKSLVETARAAITAVGTGTARTNGSPAIPASSYTETFVTTVTPTENIDSTWTVRTVVSYSVIATGDYVGLPAPNPLGLAFNMTAITQTQTSDTTNANASGSGWSAETVGLTQTVIGDEALGNATDKQTDEEWSLEITKEGAYTITYTKTVTDVAPGDGGTQTTTIVETGTVLGAAGTGFDEGKSLITFNETNLDTTYEATGTLISASFPEEAVTVSQAVKTSKLYQYIITKGSTDTYVQIMDAGIGYSNPWPALLLTK